MFYKVQSDYFYNDCLNRISDIIIPTKGDDDKRTIAKHILDGYISRTILHINLVMESASILADHICNVKNINKETFFEQVRKHDIDKLDDGDMVVYYAVACDKLYNPPTNEYDVNNAVLDRFEMVEWPKHYKRNMHHVDRFYGTKMDGVWRVSHERVPMIALGEMVADWTAMWLEKGNASPSEWLKKNQGTKFEFDSVLLDMVYNACKYIEGCTNQLANIRSKYNLPAPSDVSTEGLSAKDEITLRVWDGSNVADLEHLQEASKQAAEASHDTDDFDPNYIAEHIKKFHGTAILFMKGTECIGACEYHKYSNYQKNPDPYKTAYAISTIAVFPKYRGRGYAYTAMMLLLEKMFKSSDLPVTIGVVADNTPAVNLYKKCGFTIVSTVVEGKIKCYLMGMQKRDWEGATSSTESVSTNIYYRVTYDRSDTGIYEALKNNMTEDEWMEFKHSPAATWLPLPSVTYKKEYKSYFTQLGYNEFVKKVRPYIVKHLDVRRMRVYKYAGKKFTIVYADKYQIVTDGKDPIPSNPNAIYRIYGAILGCLGTNASKVSYRVTEDLPNDPWVAIIESADLLTKQEVELWHKYHVVDVDKKGVPYYFIVKDTKNNKEYVYYGDDNDWMPINTPDEIKKAKEAGREKGLVEEQLDFDSSPATEALTTTITSLSQITNVDELKRFFRECKYGLIDFEKGKPWRDTHTSTTDKDYGNYWRLLTPEQIVKYKCGICYDLSQMADVLLTKWHIEHKRVFAYCQDSDTESSDPTHDFCVYKDNDGNSKHIDFPESEIETISKQDVIITTRVNVDYARYQKGDFVKTSWGQFYQVVDRIEISRIQDHPYLGELTPRQIAYLGKYKQIAVLKLKRNNPTPVWRWLEGAWSPFKGNTFVWNSAEEAVKSVGMILAAEAKHPQSLRYISKLVKYGSTMHEYHTEVLRNPEIMIVPVPASTPSTESIHPNVAKNIKNNLVYHGSPNKYDKLKRDGMETGYKDKKGIFVTPFMSIAACFIINKKDIITALEKQGCSTRSINFEYSEWQKELDELSTSTTPKKITVWVKGAGDYKKFTGRSKGYIYTIDYTKYKDKTSMFTANAESDVEFIIHDDIVPEKCEEVTVDYEVIPPEEAEKKYSSQESLDGYSVEAFLSFPREAPYKEIEKRAKSHYKPVGQNSWMHIQQVYSQATRACKFIEHRTLNLKEFAAIMFHDSSVLTDTDKKGHNIRGAEIAKQELKDLFAPEDLEEIATAIVEHDGSTKWSTLTSDLLATGDANPPDPLWACNKSYSWGIKNGLTHEERIKNVITHMPKQYGSKGSMVYPPHYSKYFSTKIKEMQVYFDNLTYETAERDIMTYRKKHHLGPTDIKLPEPSVESLLSRSSPLPNDITSVDDLKQKYKSVRYGLIDYSVKPPVGVPLKDVSSMEEFGEKWQLTPPEDLFKYGYGNCVNTAYASDVILASLQIPHTVYCMFTEDIPGGHMFVVYKDVQGWKWIEASFDPYNDNNLTWSTEQSACLDICAKVAKYLNAKKYSVWKFTSFPPEGSGIQRLVLLTYIPMIKLHRPIYTNGNGRGLLNWENKQDENSDKPGLIHRIANSIGFSNESIHASMEELYLDEKFERTKELCRDLSSYDANIIDYTKGSPRVATELKTDEERVKIYRLQDPKDTEKFRCGFCWDIALLAMVKLRELGYRQMYAVYMEQNDGSEFPNNHVAVAYKDDNVWMLFEANLKNNNGLHGEFHSDAEVCKRMAANIYSPKMKDLWNGRNLKWDFYKLNQYPPVKCTASEFIAKARSGVKLGSYDSRQCANELAASHESLQVVASMEDLAPSDMKPLQINREKKEDRFKDDKFAIEAIDEKTLNMDIVHEIEKRSEHLEVLKHWVTTPDYTLVDKLAEFGAYIDEIYKFDKPIIAYRGMRVGIKDKPLQNNMGIIDVEGTDPVELVPKPGVVPGYKFTYTTTGPLSVSRSVWLSKIYGDCIVKTVVPHQCKKLVITNELAYILQKLDEKYPEYRPINLSARLEVILLPNQTLNYEVVTTRGDITSEMPEFKDLDYSNKKVVLDPTYHIGVEQLSNLLLERRVVRSSDIQVSEERLEIRHEYIMRKLREGKRCTAGELKEILQPGDILIPYPRDKKQSDFMKLFHAVERGVYGMSFTSCKLMHDKETVIGYGVKNKIERGKSAFDKTTINKFLEYCGGVMVLRLKREPPESKMKKLHEFMERYYKDAQHHDFSFIDATLGTLAYIFNVGQGELDPKKLAPEDYNKLVCSSVVAGAFYWAGIDLGLPKIKINRIMPIHMCLSDKLTCVASWFARGEWNPTIEQQLNALELQESSEAFSMEALSEATIMSRKKMIIDKICKICDIMDPSHLNSNRYHKLLDNMSAKDFNQWMTYVREGKWLLHIVVPNMVISLRNENLLKAADALNLNLFHRIWMVDANTGRKFLTDNAYLVLPEPIRRQQQFLKEKSSYPADDKHIDGMTGQVTGESKATQITNPEINILAFRGLDVTLEEMVNIRGGNMVAYGEFKKQAEETGEINLSELDPNSRSRTAVIAQVLLNAMHIETNIV